jgi:hypothetical protein
MRREVSPDQPGKVGLTPGDAHGTRRVERLCAPGEIPLVYPGSILDVRHPAPSTPHTTVSMYCTIQGGAMGTFMGVEFLDASG